MKAKAVIMRADRTNDVLTLKRKQIAGKSFRHDNVTYFLHPDRFQVTWNSFLGIRYKYRRTFYYSQGHSQPLPVPNFDPILLRGKNAVAIEKESLSKAIEDTRAGIPTKPDAFGFSGIVDNGVSGEELASLFNPWFYRIIAAQSRTLWDQLQLMGTLGACAGLVYIIFMLSTGHYKLPGAG